jgi:hypothetical protein
VTAPYGDQQRPERWQDDCAEGRREHDVNAKMQIGQVPSGEVRAGIGNQGNRGQGTVEAEEAVSDQPFVGFEQQRSAGADHCPEETGRPVDPGIVKNRRKNHGARERIVLKHDLRNAPQHPIDESEVRMIAKIIVSSDERHADLL